MTKATLVFSSFGRKTRADPVSHMRSMGLAYLPTFGIWVVLEVNVGQYHIYIEHLGLNTATFFPLM